MLFINPLMNLLRRLFGRCNDRKTTQDHDMKRFLIACLGNMGPEYTDLSLIHI